MAITATARLEARCTTDVQQLVKRAADLQGRTVSDFLITAVSEAAIRAIEQADFIRLSLRDQERFAEALVSPPKLAPALVRAFQRHDSLLGESE